MKDITHKNHYVPQFYLKNWSQDRKKIWVYSLLVPHAKVPYWQKKSIEYVAVWNDFYTQYNGEKEVDDFEKWFNKEFETPAEPVIQKLIDNKPIARQEEILLTHYVMAQDLRVPARVNDILDCTRNTINDYFDSFPSISIKEEIKKASYYSESNVKLPIKVHLNKEKRQVEFKAFVGRSFYLNTLKYTLTTTVKQAEKRKWHVIHVADGISFPTSDNPVIRLNLYKSYNNYRKNKYDFKSGWGNKHGDIIMPLSPKHVLISENGIKGNTPNLNNSVYWSEFFRKIIIEHAYRYVFAYEKQKGMLSINPRRVNKERFLAEKNTMNIWHEYNMKEEQEIMGT